MTSGRYPSATFLLFSKMTCGVPGVKPSNSKIRLTSKSSPLHFAILIFHFVLEAKDPGLTVSGGETDVIRAN